MRLTFFFGLLAALVVASRTEDLDPEFDEDLDIMDLPRPGAVGHMVAGPHSTPGNLRKISFEERTKEFIIRGKKRFEKRKESASQGPSLEKILFGGKLSRTERDAGEQITEKVSGLGDSIKDKAGDTQEEVVKRYEEAQKEATSALEKLKEKFNEQKEALAKRYKEMSEKAGEALEKAKESTKETRSSFTDKLKELRDSAASKWKELTSDSEKAAPATGDKVEAGFFEGIYKRLG